MTEQLAYYALGLASGAGFVLIILTGADREPKP